MVVRFVQGPGISSARTFFAEHWAVLSRLVLLSLQAGIDAPGVAI